MGEGESRRMHVQQLNIQLIIKPVNIGGALQFSPRCNRQPDSAAGLFTRFRAWGRRPPRSSADLHGLTHPGVRVRRGD